MMPPVIAMAIVLAALGALVAGVRMAQERFGWKPEISRKCVHMIMGLVCATFPWLFHKAWPVWLLAGTAALALAAIRLAPVLRARFGSVLGGVERKSWGELFFPPSVAFVFWLSHGDPLLFCVPVLILAFADAVAALIGQRYGFAKFETDDGWKSIEGSAAFFIAAFLSTQIPLLLFSSVGRLECVLIATAMGLILMLMEAIAWRGLDNLFIPLVCYVVLVRLMDQTVAALVTRLVALLALIASLSLWRKATRLSQSAIIATALILYVTWAVCDWHWLIAPVMTAIAYTLLCLKPATTPQKHTVHAIACIGGLGLGWLCLSEEIGTINTIYAYGVGYGTHLGIIAFAHYADRAYSRSLVAALMKSTVLGYLPLAVPYLIVWRKNHNIIPLAIDALLIIMVSIAVFARLQPGLRACPTDTARWTRQGIVAALASAAAFSLVTSLEPWSKSFL